MNASITFVNHASFSLRARNHGILCDPWYFGSVFNDGWRLLHENTDSEIDEVLKGITHIWISHEHPDHFSVPFFKAQSRRIRHEGIVCLFQRTRDQRVVSFLRAEGLAVKEVSDDVPLVIDRDLHLSVVREGFYDSALIVEVDGAKIFNLNDCAFTSRGQLVKLAKRHGICDVLLSQFSYAAWKGGESNAVWRRLAALDKLRTLALQARTLKARLVVPFASFVYFSNTDNFYMNDCINRPRAVIDYFQNLSHSPPVKFMKPLEVLELDRLDTVRDGGAVKYWEDLFELALRRQPCSHTTATCIKELEELFYDYCERLFSRNSKWLVRLLAMLPFGSFFKRVRFLVYDLNSIIEFNIPKSIARSTDEAWDIRLHSSSLLFLLKYPYGFDTLTVNACFEAKDWKSFETFSKSFSLENLNGIGIFLRWKILLRFGIILLFMRRMSRIKDRVKAGENDS
jgi:L-ascorbate metabolism protein UlaG (beta-lactamase superfamily)